MKIAVIDYEMGNLHSVCKALDKVASNARVQLASKPEEIASADRIVLPGQGAIAACINAIKNKNLLPALQDAARNKPFLGICIGPQLMSRYSSENNGVEALGFFDCETRRFEPDSYDLGEKIKIPQMGWNRIKQTIAHPLWQGIADESYFYFVHSYHLTNSPYCIGECSYGEVFPAAICRENLAGLQAHPEKSGNNGLQFLANFLSWQP